MDHETLRRGEAAIALTVAALFTASPRLALKPFGVPDDEVTGVAVLGWRLFAVRTATIGAAAWRGDPSARRAFLPVQVADQAVFAAALRRGEVAPRTAGLAMATSAVIIALDVVARWRG